MTRVRLVAKGGELVAEVDVPPFNEVPEVIFYGTRVFVMTAPAPGPPGTSRTVFGEVFAYAVADPAATPPTEAAS